MIHTSIDKACGLTFYIAKDDETNIEARSIVSKEKAIVILDRKLSNVEYRASIFNEKTGEWITSEFESNCFLGNKEDRKIYTDELQVELVLADLNKDSKDYFVYNEQT